MCYLHVGFLKIEIPFIESPFNSPSVRLTCAIFLSSPSSQLSLYYITDTFCGCSFSWISYNVQTIKIAFYFIKIFFFLKWSVNKLSVRCLFYARVPLNVMSVVAEYISV